MIGILEFCQLRGVQRLTMLSELRLAERIAAYDWPVRYLGAPHVYEGGKGTAIAAEIRVGPDILALTRQKTGVLGEVVFEVDPERTPMPVASSSRPTEGLGDILEEIGAQPLQRLMRTLALEVAGGDIDNQPAPLN